MSSGPWPNDPFLTTRGTQQAANVKTDFGGIGDGFHAAADTLAFQNAVTALPAGGILFVPPGFYTLNAAITLPKPITVVGSGFGVAGQNIGCQVVQTVDATDAFIAASDYAAFERLTVTTNVGSPTAGSGIHQTSGAYVYLDKVALSGFWDNLRFDLGQGASITRCVIVGHVRYGVFMQNTNSADTGDSQFIGNYVGGSNTSLAGLRYESSGGLRTIGNKFIKNLRGIDLQVPDGAITGVFPIVGNSIENQITNCIRIARSGATGQWSRIQIAANQINGTQISGTNDVVQLGAGISEVTVNANVIDGTASTTGVHAAAGSDGVSVVGNNFATHSVGIQRDGTNISYRGNQFRGVTTPVAGSGSLATMDSMSDEQIQAVTFAGTWSNFGGAYRNASFHRTGGRVYLGGMVKNTGTDQTIFTLPAGYRPSGTVPLTVQSSVSNDEGINITSAGLVQPSAAAHTYLSLEGLSFVAEQ